MRNRKVQTFRIEAVRWSTILVALTSLLSCSSNTGRQPATFFPQSNEVQGWTKVGETRSFPADRLYEYIDGDAERYIQASVHETLTADYKYGEKIEAVADVFVMSDATGATKVFDSQPATGSQVVQIGDAARLYQGSLLLRKRRYFVRLVAYQDTPEVPEALIGLGRSIADRIE